METNLEHIRRLRHMTKSELAKQASVSRQTISDIEAGAANATLGTLEKLAVALNCTEADLLRKQEEPPSATKKGVPVQVTIGEKVILQGTVD
ncbi:MAG: helix-turn-helix domain-containing protein [Clostridiales bacterium]|nr:helix-turn-helix domain-containing protein [Clostridiales bacterium]